MMDQRLAELEKRVEGRSRRLRRELIATLLERNLYCRKLRDIEEFGRSNGWGFNTPLHFADGEVVEGAELLQSIHAVLYDGTMPRTPRG